VLPTTFYGSQWGLRCLTCKELCSLFGFAVRLRIGDLSAAAFQVAVPVQLLQAMLLPLLAPSLSNVCSAVMPMSDKGTHESDTRSWLPHSWIDATVVTDRAVKRDDADVPSMLWDQRLMLLYPRCTCRHLDSLRTWALCWIVRRNLLRSFVCYLHATYGGSWSARLSRARMGSRLHGGKVSDKESDDLVTDVLLGSDVIRRFCWSSWWEWQHGSA
jgi:hypothetical protein